MKINTMKRWTRIFKALANSKRLEIIVLLSDGQERTVTDIASQIHVTMPGTSRHLSKLENLEIINGTGKNGHVYYSFNSKLAADIRTVIDHFLGR